MRHHVVTVIALLGALLLPACDNECDFFERCAGDVLQVCGDGPDQSFGRRVRELPCEAPNTACVERDDKNAACVLPEKATCEDATEARCDGDVLVSCQRPVGYSDESAEPARYLVGVDCAAEGATCTTTRDAVICEVDGG